MSDKCQTNIIQIYNNCFYLTSVMATIIDRLPASPAMTFRFHHSCDVTSNTPSFLRRHFTYYVIPAMSLHILRHSCDVTSNITSFLRRQSRESVSTWHIQPLSECILKHITRSRWQCLPFHLARSTLLRLHSKAHYPFQVAMLTLPPGTLNPCQSAF